MSDVQSLSAELRGRAGKGAARQTRRDGRVPGVIYGNKQPATLISVAPKDLMTQLRKRAFQATLFDIELAGKKERVLPRDVQFDPISDAPIHIDFMRVGEHSRVRVDVPVKFLNEAASPGLKRGAFGFDDFVALLGSDQGVLAGNGVGVFGEEAGRFGGLFGVGLSK